MLYSSPSKKVVEFKEHSGSILPARIVVCDDGTEFTLFDCDDLRWTSMGYLTFVHLWFAHEQKIQKYADKLSGFYKEQRPVLCKIWDHLKKHENNPDSSQDDVDK